MKLSIAIITWNRSIQLIEALTSCVLCKLPADTQFVIIDNASTDDTETKVKHFFENRSFLFYYEKMAENMGAGIGRNYAFSKCNGEYVYFLDDDAYIDVKVNDDFFLKAINILDAHQEIVTLTTQIYDLMLKLNRVSGTGPIIYDGLRKLFMVCGGSHFLRRTFFSNDEPYFSNKYGYEELKPSLLVYDAGLLNVFAPELIVIHNPTVNKWNYNEKKNQEVLIRYVVNQFILKSNIYPSVCYPLCYGVYLYRKHKYLKGISKDLIKKVFNELRNSCSLRKRIRIKTVYFLYKNFGLSIF